MKILAISKVGYNRFADNEMKLFFEDFFGKAAGRDHYLTYSTQEKKLFFKAVDNGKTIGVVCLRIGHKVASIGAFVVLRGSRGAGAGTMLLEKCESVAKKNKCKKIWLWTLPSIKAYEFYKRNGYVEEARLEKHWGGKYPMSVMSKFL